MRQNDRELAAKGEGGLASVCAVYSGIGQRPLNPTGSSRRRTPRSSAHRSLKTPRRHPRAISSKTSPISLTHCCGTSNAGFSQSTRATCTKAGCSSTRPIQSARPWTRLLGLDSLKNHPLDKCRHQEYHGLYSEGRLSNGNRIMRAATCRYDRRSH